MPARFFRRSMSSNLSFLRDVATSSPIDWLSVKSGMAFIKDGEMYWYLGQDFETPRIHWFFTDCRGLRASKLTCLLDTSVRRARPEYDFVVRR